MFLTAFLVPVLLILIFNIVMYVLILRSLVSHVVQKNKRLGKSSMTPSEAIKMLMSFTGIMVLFGLTWVFAVFTFISEPGVSYTIQFFFAFFNAFQGFFIFIFFVILSSDSRDAWRLLLCPCFRKDKPHTTKYNLSSSNKKVSKDSIPNSCKPSSSYGSKSGSMNEKSKLPDNGNEYITARPYLPSLSEEDDPAIIDQFLLKGMRLVRRSTRRRTHHVEEVQLDFFENDDVDDDDIVDDF